jgi:hypothetical protein
MTSVWTGAAINEMRNWEGVKPLIVSTCWAHRTRCDSGMVLASNCNYRSLPEFHSLVIARLLKEANAKFESIKLPPDRISPLNFCLNFRVLKQTRTKDFFPLIGKNCTENTQICFEIQFRFSFPSPPSSISRHQSNCFWVNFWLWCSNTREKVCFNFKWTSLSKR